MKKLFLSLLLCVLSAITYGQTFFVKVFDKNSKLPIEKAHLKLGAKVYLTNSEGLAIITPLKTTRLEITHLQYQKQTIYLKGKRRKEIFLLEKQSILDEVVITSKRELKKYINYKELEKLPKPIHSFSSVIIKDKLYTFGGDGSVLEYSNKRGLSEILDSNEANIMKFLTKAKIGNFYRYRNQSFVYDFNIKEWKINSKKLHKRAYHKAVLHKDLIYILGGKRLTLTKKKEMLMGNIEVFDPINNSIKVDEMNPHLAVNFESLVFEDKLLVIGGSTKMKESDFKELKEYTDKIHLYDFKTGYWYLLTNMSKGKETSGIIINKKLYLFGGFKDKGLKEIETFDLVTGKWKTEGNLVSAMKRPAITRNNNTVYLFENNIITSYNTITKELKNYRIDLPIYGATMHFKNNHLYIVGGTEVGEFSNTPKSSFLEISLDEFESTEIKEIKTLNQTL